MKYERFEDLPVWKAAMDLALGVYETTRDRAFDAPGDVRDQIRRAALSISNNIAEGFERGSTAELLHYLYIARGSAGEVRSILIFCERWPATAHMKTQIAGLKSLAESCSRQIRAWADSLQNSDIPGQRHLTDRSRRAYEDRRQAEAMDRELEEILSQATARREAMRGEAQAPSAES